ncbi:methionine--tRNA ligase, partial [Salmonella enterica subsp. enterica serovar Typhimurium]|nr:methionine--tRNA ligase [Salmonella enterica subsp. enterica serovar Typhimurium]
KPWDLAKNSEKNDELHRVCSILLNAFFTLTVYLKPILPSLAKKVEHFLNLPREIRWDDAGAFLADHIINDYSHLMTRIDPKQVVALVDA